MKTTKHDFTSGLYPTGRYGDNVMCDYTYTASAWGQMGGGVCDCMCVQVDVCVCVCRPEGLACFYSYDLQYFSLYYKHWSVALGNDLVAKI